MDYIVRIDKLMDDNNGFLVTDYVTKANIPRVYIREMLDNGDIIKAERGIYLKKGVKDDELYRAQLKYKGIVYSHETALMLNGFMKNKKVSKLMVTVKTGINPTKLKERGLKVFTIKNELMDLGLVTINTKNGNPVKCYNMERTVCDIVRSRNQVEGELLGKTLSTYFKSEQCDEKTLYEYADALHVTKIIDEYRKVLFV